MSKKNQVIKKYVDIFDDFVTSHFIRENNYYVPIILHSKKLHIRRTNKCISEPTKKLLLQKQIFLH